MNRYKLGKVRSPGSLDPVHETWIVEIDRIVAPGHEAVIEVRGLEKEDTENLARVITEQLNSDATQFHAKLKYGKNV